MKRIYVNEEWCLACHLCEYVCTFANSGLARLTQLKKVKLHPNIKVEEKGKISFAVSCRHCENPLCVKSCLTGAMKIENGIIKVDKQKCIGCYTCILVCPYGAISPSADETAVQKCELCTNNSHAEPLCVKKCPNNAIVFEDRGE